MDFVALLEQFGIPVVVALAFGFFIWKQNKFIQDELMEELDERFKRLESIVIKLIDQQKLMQMDIKEYKGALRMFVKLLKELRKK
jgi:K+-transporting ATPase A subunit